MNRGELHAELESRLRQSWARPDLVIDSVRPPNHVSSELTARPGRALDSTNGTAIERNTVDGLVERHRQQLSAASGRSLDRDEWWEGFRIALRLEAINRVPYQWLFATKIKPDYVFRMTRSVHFSPCTTDPGCPGGGGDGQAAQLVNGALAPSSGDASSSS
jgi:hypothetical protein